MKYLKFKNQAQENKKVHLFEEMTNASIPSEKKPPLGASKFKYLKVDLHTFRFGIFTAAQTLVVLQPRFKD